MKINLQQFTAIILDVCKDTAEDLQDISQQITLIVTVVSHIFSNIGMEIDEPAHTRDLRADTLVQSVIEKLQEVV
jgi:hypothetical protein